jgi:hypothetical protein
LRALWGRDCLVAAAFSSPHQRNLNIQSPHRRTSQLEVAVELLGERTLRIEELEVDVNEMKTIFKSQLDEAMRQLERHRAGPGGGSDGKG